MTMELLDLLRRRRSVRVYQTRAVEKEKLSAILEAVRAAPSAGNLQAFEVVVVETAERKTALAGAALDQQHVAGAPVLLVFCANPGRSASKYGGRGSDLYARQDATIACAHAQLAAASLGLGCCWVGAFYPEVIRQILKAPTGLEPIALLSIGYPDEEPLPVERRPIDDLVRWETF
jgi:nitroreductase